MIVEVEQRVFLLPARFIFSAECDGWASSLYGNIDGSMMFLLLEIGRQTERFANVAEDRQ